MTDRLEARVENAVHQTLWGAGWFVPPSVRRDVARAVMAVVSEEDEPESTGCCAKDGMDCPWCTTGRCSKCPECIDGLHYGYGARDDEETDDAEF